MEKKFETGFRGLFPQKCLLFHYPHALWTYVDLFHRRQLRSASLNANVPWNCGCQNKIIFQEMDVFFSGNGTDSVIY